MTDLLLHYDPNRLYQKHYKTLIRIGEGGFGSVHRCEHLLTGDRRAVKIISKANINQDMHFVLVEIEALLLLDHPNIVKFYEFFEQDECILLITELCACGDFGLLHRSRCPLEEIRPLFRDMMLGIAYCHDQNVVHRDLKLENCLLCEGQTRKIAKVIDFGLSAIRMDAHSPPQGEDTPKSPKEDNEDWLQEALGTKYFAAPEVIDKNKKYGTKCDLWSAGVMLYILCTNEHPFAEQASRLPTKALFKAVCTSPMRVQPLLKARVPEDACGLMRSLITRDTARRVDAIGALSMPWLRPKDSHELDFTNCLPRKKATRIAERLNSWSETTYFEKVLLMLVGHQAKLKEVDDMRVAFMSLDKNGDGSLSKEELRCGLQTRGYALSDFEDMFSWLDSNENAKLDYSEWLSATLEPQVIAAENSIRELFDYFDADSSGSITCQELTRVVSSEEAKHVLELNDVSKDGVIDYKEFKELLESLARVRGKGSGPLRPTPLPSPAGPVVPDGPQGPVGPS
mmetsp:Transcript_97001/g.302520  ORF Transcript_97001/g.302520 Transcript_97001/m.302520 type:complete len:512 (-) Transcript_97001:39-1574(-)